MLRELHIRDFAIIDDLTLQFSDGFNVLTGETGAGKSILMQAVNLLCGGRAPTDVIRTGADEASIEGLFDRGEGERLLLDQLGLPAEEELLIRRLVSRSGKSRVYVNGTLTNLSGLERLGQRLIHVYGQHDQALLLRSESHLELLDAYAGHLPLLAAMAESHAHLEERLAKLLALRTAQQTAEQRADLIRFQLDELEKAALEEGEDERLQREREILVHAERLAQLCQQGEEALYSGDDAVGDRLTRIDAQLHDAARIDPAFGEIDDILESAAAQVEEVAQRLRAYGERLSFDPERREEVEERLTLLNRLKRKHGGSLEAAIAARDSLASELRQLESIEADLGGLEKEVSAAAARAWEAAAALSESRRTAGKRLERSMVKELRSLGMEGAAFATIFSPEKVERRFDPGHPLAAAGARLTRSGADTLEFHLSANPGEAAKPLARIASGGELSRIMLALKVLTAGTGDVPTLIFDEVDAGIGGQVAYAVGDRLHHLGDRRQVLCITHLPQIAARATHHFIVEKQTRRGRTVSAARQLTRDDRIAELTRMLGGSDSAEAARFARRLIASLDPNGGRSRPGDASPS